MSSLFPFRVRYALAMIVPDVIVRSLPATWRKEVQAWVYPPKRRSRV